MIFSVTIIIKECDEGYVRNGDLCEECPIGQQSGEDGITCVDCPPNTSNNDGNIVCRMC